MKKLYRFLIVALISCITIFALLPKNVSASPSAEVDKSYILSINSNCDFGYENQAFNISECDYMYFVLYDYDSDSISLSQIYWFSEFTYSNIDYSLYFFTISIPSNHSNLRYSIIATYDDIMLEGTTYLPNVSYYIGLDHIQYTTDVLNNGVLYDSSFDDTYSYIALDDVGYYTNGLAYGYTSTFTFIPNFINVYVNDIVSRGKVMGIRNGVNYFTDNDLPIPFLSSIMSLKNDLYMSGYNIGVSQGFEDGRLEGFNDGYNNGYTDGYSNGFDEGLISNQQNIYNNGYNAGTTYGYELGLDTGYDNGYLAGLGESNTWFKVGLLGLIDIPLNTLRGILDFDLLGFNLYNVFFALTTIALVIWLLKKFIYRR